MGTINCNMEPTNLICIDDMGPPVSGNISLMDPNGNPKRDNSPRSFISPKLS